MILIRWYCVVSMNTVKRYHTGDAKRTRAYFLLFDLKNICRPQSLFFTLVKLSQQFSKKGISSLKPLILIIHKV